jgi:hypothetical protein
MRAPGAKYDKNYMMTDINPRMARIWKEGE